MILIAVLAATLEMFLPWWTMVIAAFAVGLLIKQSGAGAFFAGFLAVFLLWTGYAFMLSHGNNDILARKVAMLLPLHGNVTALLLVTGFVGGLVAGLASLSGRLIRT